MTLDEAIKHCEEVADNKEQQIKEEVWEKGSLTEKNCYKCAEEHRQLAEWLRELKDYRERMPSYEAGYNDAKREIALSGEYERAYERGKADAIQALQTEKTGHWIVNKKCGSIYCSECGCGALYDKVYPGESVFGKAIRVKSTFCPTCGTMMVSHRKSSEYAETEE